MKSSDRKNLGTDRLISSAFARADILYSHPSVYIWLDLRSSTHLSLTPSSERIPIDILSDRSLLGHHLGLVLGDLCNSRTCHHRVVPLLKVGCTIVNALKIVTHEEGKQHVPAKEGKIGIGAFVADEPAGAVLLQLLVYDLGRTLDRVGVAVDGGGDVLLRVEVLKPGQLSPVGTCRKSRDRSAKKPSRRG